jgi:hypothetical protein
MNWSEWIHYFQRNRENLMPIEWENVYRLSAYEKAAILASIQEFQLGESSEGRNLIEAARRYADRTGDVQYVPALQWFIQEEQRHARDLGRFMMQQGLPLAQSHWVDSIFRFLRRTFNLEVSVVVLLTAEIIAVAYYKALHDATASPVLRGLCRQILRDESQHLRFQIDTLTHLRQGRSALALFVAGILQRILFIGTLLVVWSGNHRVYRAGRVSWGQFWWLNWRLFNRLFAGLGSSLSKVRAMANQ